MEQYGFIYKIICVNKELPIFGKFYIGKKAYLHKKTVKLTKKELAEYKGKGRKPKTKVTYVDSGWKEYFGSSKELLEDVQLYGKESFKLKIIKKCKDKISLTYWEQYYQFQENVLFSNSYNGNIAGKFYKGRIT